MRARTLLRPKATYGRQAFEEIFSHLDLRTDAQKADFLGIAESSFSRTRRGVIKPGEDFIAAAIDAVDNEPRLQGHPAADFKKLFPIKKLPAKDMVST